MLNTKGMFLKICEFIQSMKTESAWTAMTTSEGGCDCRIIKGFVWVDLYQVNPTTSWKTICTLPQKYRPLVNVRTQGYCGVYGRTPMTVTITTAGELRISTTTAPGSGNGYATIIFPAQ